VLAFFWLMLPLGAALFSNIRNGGQENEQV